MAGILNNIHKNKNGVILFSVICISTILKLKTNNELSLLYDLFANPHWLFHTIAIIIFSIWILKYDGVGVFHEKKHLERAKDAVKKAVIAFIIALCAYLDISTVVFWFVWGAGYYLSNWV
tara:strand:+ start:6555 stop:6914 length:360 start_codon:yes stop_codon:yes gene_type:complete